VAALAGGEDAPDAADLLPQHIGCVKSPAKLILGDPIGPQGAVELGIAIPQTVLLRGMR
jgi:hypothetical protein